MVILIPNILNDTIIYTSVPSVKEGTEVFKGGTEASDHHLSNY
jgi:hypothetical protein